MTELRTLHALFVPAQAEERTQLYALCVPLLTELRAFNRPPFPGREITALTREVDWHLRSLAGLGTGGSSKEEEHTAWALGGLERLARCAGPC